MQFPRFPNGAYRILASRKEGRHGSAQGGRADTSKDGGLQRLKTPDGQVHNQDSYEAVWERRIGRPIAYAEARYSTPVVMRAKGFRWIADPNRPQRRGQNARRLQRIPHHLRDVGGSLRARAIVPEASSAPEETFFPAIREHHL